MQNKCNWTRVAMTAVSANAEQELVLSSRWRVSAQEAAPQGAPSLRECRPCWSLGHAWSVPALLSYLLLVPYAYLLQIGRIRSRKRVHCSHCQFMTMYMVYHSIWCHASIILLSSSRSPRTSCVFLSSGSCAGVYTTVHDGVTE